MLQRRSTQQFRHGMPPRGADKISFHGNIALPFLLFLPLTMAMLAYVYFSGHLHWATAIPLFAAGCVLWTFYEYVLHRFLFHFHPRTQVGELFVWLAHENHHIDPYDPHIVVAHPWVSLPSAVLTAAILYALFGASGLVVSAGFSTTYVYYEYVHYSVHFGQHRIAWTNAQRTRHLRHHFNDGTREFGVTTGLWDHVFRTVPPRSSPRPAKARTANVFEIDYTKRHDWGKSQN